MGRVARAALRRVRPRRAALTPPPAEQSTTLASEIRAARVLPGGLLELSGWAFRRHGPDPVSVVVVAVGPAGRTVQWEAKLRDDEEVNAAEVERSRDRSRCGFLATLDPASLVAEGPESDHRWRIEIRLSDDRGVRQEPFATIARFGSAGMVPPIAVGPRVVLAALGKDGLTLRVERPRLSAEQVRAVGTGTLALTVRAPRHFDVHSARLVQVATPGGATPTGRGPGRTVQEVVVSGWRDRRLSIELPPGSGESRTFDLELTDRWGGRSRVWWVPGSDGEADADVVFDQPQVRVAPGPKGHLQLDYGFAATRVSGADLVAGSPDSMTIMVTGLAAGRPGETPGSEAIVHLVGQRQQIALTPSSTTTVAGAPAVVFETALTGQAPFAQDEPPLSSGIWHLLLDTGPHSADTGGPEPVRVDRVLASRLGQRQQLESLSVRVERARDDMFAMRIAAPREHGRAGRFRTLALGRDIRWSAGHVGRNAVQEAVLFDCFDGRSVGDNPAAIRDELLGRREGLPEYWVVSDRSVPLPPGATGVIWHSREYFELRTHARYLVTNCWLKDFRRGAGQRVMQTWHGTPLKRLGRDRVGFSEPRRTSVATDSAQWNWLITQNPYSTDILSRAYLYEGEVAEIGYPRNDALLAPSGSERDAWVRERLGLEPDERVVLFAPTWRVGGADAVGGLDLAALTAGLGSSVRVLARGHANTVAAMSSVRRDRVVDVTVYPDLADLIRVADVLITDYSSIMFDFSVTGKPMIFFVPDLEQYVRGQGVYFDLAERAPGPLLRHTEDVVSAVRSALGAEPGGASGPYAEKYRRWRSTFNPLDDGEASRRAVDLLLGESAC